MKKLIKMLFAAALFAAAPAASAQAVITNVDKIQPNEQVFMDMAVSAAKTSVADDGLPCGAVVILNGAWRSTGMPSNEQSAEQVAINKSRSKSLANAQIYTVVQPTSAACKAIAAAGTGAVYFAVPAADAIAAGIYKASDYEGGDDSVKMTQVPYSDADALVGQWKASK